MNLRVMKLLVTNKVGRGLLLVKKFSPEILIGVGIVGTVASTVMACKATLKVEKVLDDAKAHLEAIELAKATVSIEEYSKKDVQKDLVITYVKAGVDLAKLYGPAILVGGASVACLLGSHNIMRKRNLAVIAAYKAIEEGFAKYRNNVVEELGEAKDEQFRYGFTTTKRTVEKMEIDPVTGMPHTVLVEEDGLLSDTPSVYSKFFDETCPSWTRSADYNRAFIQAQQNYCNDLLHSRGHLFLNEVYSALEFPHTSAGAVVGWVTNSNASINADHCVDFGVFNAERTKVRDFVNGYERSILLDFNVDGVIWDLI